MEHLIVLANTHVPILWVEFFRFFFGWPDEQIARWAKPYEEDLLDPESYLYHDSLLKPIVGLLIPTPLLRNEDLSGVDKINLAALIGNAVAGENATKDPIPGWDWEAAAARVDRVLSAYGYTTSDIDKTFRRYDSSGDFVPVV